MISATVEMLKNLYLVSVMAFFRVFVYWIIIGEEDEGQLSNPHPAVALLPVVS